MATCWISNFNEFKPLVCSTLLDNKKHKKYSHLFFTNVLAVIFVLKDMINS